MSDYAEVCQKAEMPGHARTCQDTRQQCLWIQDLASMICIFEIN